VKVAAQSIYFDKTTNLHISDEKNQPKLNWNDGIEYCKNLELSGYDDWYLPTINEMASFEDRSNLKSFLKKELKHTNREDYWSSTQDAVTSEYAWSQGLMYKAYNHTHNKKDKKYIRCVRSDNKKIEKDFYFRYKDTVINYSKNIMWEDTNNSKNLTLDYNSSIQYCKNLKLNGYEDWKLPSINTLRTLVDYDRFHPSLNDEFKNYSYGGYYSSTPYYGSEEHSEGIEFNIGVDGISNKKDKWYLRCYRDIKSTNDKSKVSVYFNYDNSVLFIDGKKWGKLKNIMDDFNGTPKIELKSGVHHFRVQRVSKDGKYKVIGERVFKLKKDDDIVLRIVAQKKEEIK